MPMEVLALFGCTVALLAWNRVRLPNENSRDEVEDDDDEEEDTFSV